MTPRPCPCGHEARAKDSQRRAQARTLVGLSITSCMFAALTATNWFNIAAGFTVAAWVFVLAAYLRHPLNFAPEVDRWTLVDERARRAEHDRILDEAMRRHPVMRHRRQDGAA